MQAITQGQNLVISTSNIVISVECKLPDSDKNAIDVSAFLLAKDNKTRNDNDFIFYNQPQSLDKSVSLSLTPAENQSFSIDLSLIDSDIEKIAFVITLPAAFKFASHLTMTVENIATFSPKLTQMNETSLILAEVYKHKGQWKFKAIGQGYAGGLAPIAIGYGVSVDDEPQQPLPQKPEPASTPVQKNTAPVSIKKIDLSTAGETATISLAKGQKLSAKLQWNTNADLDLYCFYVDKHDVEDKIYYKQLGDLSHPPFIKLLGDSQVAGEEVLEISQPDNIKYALICAYSAVSNGVGSFHSYKARLQVSDNDQQTVTSHLNHDDPHSFWVAFSLITFGKAGEVTITNVETYSNAETFRTQFAERSGSQPSKFFKLSKTAVNGVTKYHPERSPYLFKDGTFMMAAGAIEFK